MSRELQAGDAVLISAEGRGADIGRIEDIRPIFELPAIPEAPSIAVVREIFREMQIRRIAVISHRAGTLIFAAIESHSGEWYDLQNQKLTISVVEPAMSGRIG